MIREWNKFKGWSVLEYFLLYPNTKIHINELKRKIKETEDLIQEIESIKAQEDREISNWQKHIFDIKAKLLEVDKNLFEV